VILQFQVAVKFVDKKHVLEWVKVRIMSLKLRTHWQHVAATDNLLPLCRRKLNVFSFFQLVERNRST